MKKIISLMIALSMIVTVFTGCSSEGENGIVYVANWGEYIDPDLLDQFEEETGIKVVYEEYATNEDLHTKMANGGAKYDVVIPSDYMVAKMIDEDLIQPLNFDNIPNYQYIREDLKAAEYDPTEEYSVPYFWGTLGIVYDTTKVDEEITSWASLFDEKYAGEIIMVDSVRDAFAVAFDYLGYSLNTTNPDEIEEAKELLIEQKPLVMAYVVDEVMDMMAMGEATLAVTWSGNAEQAITENEDLAYVIPSEGSNIWVEALVIPTNAENVEQAEAFINFLCDPEVAAQNAEWVEYSTPNTEAFKLLDEEVQNNEAIYPSDEVLEKTESFINLDNETLKLYNDAWMEVKASN